jgi:mono/diheme cytochrome c family protein
LPLIEALDGRNVTQDKTTAYPGYPLVTSAESTSVWFYVFLPALAVVGWWFNQRAPAVPESAGGTPTAERWPWLRAHVPRLRRIALWGGATLLVLQLVPYGRDHTNLTVSQPSAAAAASCQTIFPPGGESAMRLSDFRARLGAMLASLNATQAGLAANDLAAARAQYAQFGSAYRGVALEIAELYPGRCPRLNGDVSGGDAAMQQDPTAGAIPATRWLYSLGVGLLSLSQDLDVRIRQEGPDQLVGLLSPETDRPSVSGTPAWNSERTQALATRACASCHSNQPTLPWYTNVAPLSWLVQYQVDAGRSAMNLSEWDRPQVSGASRAASSTQAGTMPPGWMTTIDSRLKLSDAERAELVRGLLTTLNGAPSS